MAFPEARFSDITTNDLRHFLSLFIEDDYKPWTLWAKYYALKNYFGWLAQEQVITHNPADPIKFPRPATSLAAILTSEEKVRFIDASKDEPRDHVMAVLLLEAGLKRSELMELTEESINISDPSQPKVTVEADRNFRRRTFTLPADFTSSYTSYIGQYKSAGNLFSFTERQVFNILAAIAHCAGISHKIVSCRILRDTFAVQCLKSGDKMGEVRKKLGLSSGAKGAAVDKYRRLAVRYD